MEYYPNRIRIWVEEIRAPFLTATLVPILLGTVVAWEQSGRLHPSYFFLTLIAGFLLHAGTNVANDYFDHETKDDDINTEFVRPFSGGSRMIQKGLLSPREVLAGSLLLFSGGILMGLYIAYSRGLPILYLGLIGVFSGFFYSAPPFRLAHRGVGEIFVGLNFGILMTMGAYYAQAQEFTLVSFMASLPVAFLIAAILYINEFPDYTADKAVGKNHIVARLGKKNAVKGYVFLMIAPYVSIILGIMSGMLSPFCVLGFLTLPQAIKAIKTARLYYGDTPRLVPANATTIMVHLLTGLLMSASYVLDKLV